MVGFQYTNHPLKFALESIRIFKMYAGVVKLQGGLESLKMRLKTGKYYPLPPAICDV